MDVCCCVELVQHRPGGQSHILPLLLLLSYMYLSSASTLILVPKRSQVKYRAIHLLADLGLVDLDLGCPTVLLGQHRSCSTAQQPVEHPKSKSTQSRSAMRWVTLYKWNINCSSLAQNTLE